jgi:acetyl esterase/lipase
MHVHTNTIRCFAVLNCCILGLRANVVSAEEASPAYVQHQNVVYGEEHGIGLLMDVFTPTGPSNGLGIIDVISGAWHSDRGKIRDHTRAQTFQILCGKGYTVFAVRPGSVTKFSVPEMLANLNQGIRWVKHHADEYGVDPDRLGLMGASAGAHLACLAAVTADNEATTTDKKHKDPGTRVRAVAVFFPVTDFLDFGGKAVDVRANNGWGELIRGLAFPGGLSEVTDADVAKRLTQISPARLVTPKSPPFLLIHGDADPVVPLQQSQRMLAALNEAQVAAQLIVKPGGGHPWLTLHEEVQVLADWFDRQLK